MNNSIAAILIGTCFLAACDAPGVTSSPSRPLTASEQQLRQQQDAFNTTVIEGALVGAMLGAALGGLAGGDTQSALLGAAAGGALGAGTGFAVAGRQQQFATQEQALDAAIQEAAKFKGEAQRAVATQESIIAKDTATLNRLRSEIQAGTATREELVSELAAARSNYQVMQGMSADMATKASSDLQQNVNNLGGSSPKGAQLAAETNAYRAATAEFQANLDAYDDFLDAFRAGES